MSSPNVSQAVRHSRPPTGCTPRPSTCCGGCGCANADSCAGPTPLSRSFLVFGGPRSLGELADAEQVRPPTMSRIVAALESAGLVRRHATEDGRRVRLEASAKGTKILQEGRKRRVESLAKALSSLSEEEQQKLGTLTDLLRQVIRNL